MQSRGSFISHGTTRTNLDKKVFGWKLNGVHAAEENNRKRTI